MVNKRKIHHWLVVVRRVKTWQLILLLLIFGGLSVYLLRQNNLGMVEWRNAVKTADQEGADLQPVLGRLQAYVTSHMNTDLGEGIFLEHSYQRAYDAALQAAADPVNPNSNIYSQAETNCRASHGGNFQLYLSCVQNAVKAVQPGRDPLADVKPPAVELYKVNYVSPRWSPDAAGWAVLATVIVMLMLVIRLTSFAILRLVLMRRSSS